MYADSGDFSEWKTGRQSTGLIFSASSMTQKLGGALGGSITLWLLAIYGFMPNVAQSAHTLNGIKYMMGIVPGAAALISGLFMIFYPLSDKKMTTISSELAIRRAAETE
jgi:GPH family glycoside/pentoside/hexuronide:cation symporter